MRKSLLWGLLILMALASMLVRADDAKTPSPRPWLGMGMRLQTQPDGKKFIYVAHAPENAPAHDAGVRSGDLITAIGGRQIRFRDDLDIVEFSAALRVGQMLELKIVRAGRPRKMHLRVGTMPSEFEERFVESLERARAARARGES